jgi:valyl-tRNA synthetase
MPFITEELWQFLKKDEDEESIVIAKWPELEHSNKELIPLFEDCMQVVGNVRNIRQDKNISMRDKLTLNIIKHGDYNSIFDPVVVKLGNLSEILPVNEKLEMAAGFLVKAHEYFIPLEINKEEEIKKLQEELKYTEGFLNGVMKKLSNERFVSNAPDKVIEIERKKQSDAEAKIKILKEQIEGLK